MCYLSRILAVGNYALTRLADIGCRVFASPAPEDDMATTTARRPKPTPIVTVEEIDEALTHTANARNRDEHWHRWADALLDQRLRVQRPARETRVMHIDETRGQA